MRRKKPKYPVTKFEGHRIRQLPGTGKNNDETYFMADFNRNGTRIRQNFKTQDEAETFIHKKNIEVQNKGRAAFDIADQDRIDLMDIRKRLDKSVRLSALADFWEIHHPAGEAKTVKELVADFLAAPGHRGKKGVIVRREATRHGLEKRLALFEKTFATLPAAAVSQLELEQWLDVNGWHGRNRIHYLAAVRAMFNHGLRKGVVLINPAEKIETPTPESAPPVIMAPDAVQSYLDTLSKSYPELLPREALSFFCGLRPDEAARLEWQNVNMEEKRITIGKAVAKMRRIRHVEMPDCLIKWLAPYAVHNGPVWRFSQSYLFKARREAVKAAKVILPPNAGRHAFASYHLALHENAPKTAEAMGHADVDLLKTVYRNITASNGRPITKATAETYFKIAPKQDAQVIPIRAAG